ncbi:MAG TPA: FG-GAP-like repeat-containing protein [Lacunisphaera sp.]|nr:FG-GAP-like repeat-containing protein [Lacunisphaera sp.]
MHWLAGLVVLAGGLASAASAVGAPPATGGLQVEPLAPRSGPPGPAMFAALPAAQTGIATENRFADPEMWGRRYQELVYGESGSGVAIGDFDNDGRPDLLVVEKTEGCRLFRNLGGWKFEDVTAKAGVVESRPDGWAQGVAWLKRTIGADGAATPVDAAAWRQGATFVDVNNDGWLDIYICRFGAPNLLFINQGDGTFKEEAAARGLALADASGMGSFCDYDRDGWLDVYVTANMLDAAAHPNGQRGHLFHNNGDGTFTDVTARAGIDGESLTHSATWWDYDGDGWPDLYVANDYSGPDRLYHNNRDGTFTNVIDRVVPHTPYYAMGSDFGDVDNDGRPDFIVADMATTTREKDLRGMAGSRERAQLEPARPGEAPQYMRGALYLNTGTGRCLEAGWLAGVAATDWTWSVRFEDLDNDGRLDLHVTNGMIREYHNADILQRVMAAEDPQGSRRMMRASPKLAETNLAFRNEGDLKFEEVGARWGLNQRGVSFGAAFGDLDGDGDLDLVFANYEGGVTVLRNDCPGGHRLIVALRGTQSNRFGVGATVRIESALGVQVRTLQLARGYLSCSEPVLHFGLGDDTVVTKLTVSWPSGTEQTFTGLPVDRRLTITEPATPRAQPVAPAPVAAGQFADSSQAAGFARPAGRVTGSREEMEPLQPVRFNGRGPALAVGDLDGDGRDDAVIGGTLADPARLLGSPTPGAFQPLMELPRDARLDDGPVLIFDADGDGANDVLVTKGGAGLPAGAAEYQPVLWHNDRHGHLQPQPGALPPLPLSVGAAAAVDFDRDGRLDLFLGGRVVPGRYPEPARSALLRNTGGRFEDVTEALAPGLREIGLVTAALWSDVDRDGWPDLLIALEWGQVRYFHNEHGRGFADWTERAGFAAAGAGWWTSLASADFNGDGRPDFVAGNIGLNTQYHASPAAPAVLFRGEFARAGAAQLVEGVYEEGRLLPWRTRKALGAEIPAVLQRYRQDDLYARAALEDIVGADKLAAAHRFAATELRSGVFLSQPDGTYRFEPLPRLAQIAPFQGVVAGDFDGDGHADIYAVQNSHAPAPMIGWFDGGLSQLLRGDGHGHFTPVAPIDSGLVVPGDAKALALADLDGDGWPDFLVTRSGDATLAFHNGGVAGRHALAVRLRGPAGNPSGIGARLALELADGSRQTVELQAGSGYYSQSSATAFFGWLPVNPPKQLQVLWPGGAVTNVIVPADAKSLTIPAP